MDVGLVQTKWVEGGGSSSESWRREREVGVIGDGVYCYNR